MDPQQQNASRQKEASRILCLVVLVTQRWRILCPAVLSAHSDGCIICQVAGFAYTCCRILCPAVLFAHSDGCILRQVTVFAHCCCRILWLAFVAVGWCCVYTFVVVSYERRCIAMATGHAMAKPGHAIAIVIAIRPLLVRHCSAIAQLLGRYWAAIGPLLGRYWPRLLRYCSAIGPLGPILGLAMITRCFRE